MPPKSRSKAAKSRPSEKNATSKPSSRKTRQTVASLDKQFGLSVSDEEEFTAESANSGKHAGANIRLSSPALKNSKSKKKPTKATKPRSKRTQKLVDPESDIEVDETSHMNNSHKEEDDGFVFTRAKPSKESTAKSTKKTTRKRKQQQLSREPTSPSSPPVKGKRANMRKSRSETTPNLDTNETPFPAKRLRTNEPIFTTHQSNDNMTSEFPTGPSITPEHSHTMALPISDTPVIRRNQELRRKSGVRRSSLGNRGKRMSSIGNGFVAEPHEEVDFKEFYKHSSVDDSEPVRMRQILTWCSKRALEIHVERDHKENLRKKSSMEDITARKIAQVIKDELVRDLVEMKITTSWWSRPEEAAAEERPKRPNANNITNEQNLIAFQQKLQALKNERESWLTKLEAFRAKKPENLPSDSGSLASQREAQMAAINENAASFEKARQSCKQLGYHIDRLFDAVHRIKSLSEATGMFREHKMEELHESLPHDEAISQPPMRDTLRTLSRVDK